MGTLGYAVTVSLDGYVADANGDFSWSGPSDAIFDVHVARLRRVTASILGRKTYQLMEYWESFDELEATEAEYEFARIWCALAKTVVSTTGLPPSFGPFAL